MKRDLYYSILKYRHGLILGESLNAGILFFDPISNRFVFENGDIKRIAHIYPEVNINFLKKFIDTLENNIKKSNEPNFFQFKAENLKDFITKELLFSDAAGLSFESLERIPLSANTDFKQTLNYLKQLFLVDLNEPYQNKIKRNEDYILSEVIKIIKKKDSRVFTKIERNKKITTPLIEFTFDICWNSNLKHLAKALSFDLENNILIQNKALQIYGALSQSETDLANQFGPYELDFLVSKPTRRDHFQDFDKAIKIIESTNLPSNFSFEDQWDQYVSAIIENAIEINAQK